MKIKCEYCASLFDDTLVACPNCGKGNKNVRRSTPDQPTTIEGLKQWYRDRGLPPEETTRFFIGKNYQQPKAFGIYQDERTGNFVVYKNKADGTRAVRYEGTDEAYAVNELLTRLKQEILEQKSHNIKNGQPANAPQKSRRRRRSRGVSLTASMIIFAVITASCAFPYFFMTHMEKPSKQGFYQVNDEDYYRGKLFYHYGSDGYGWVVYDTDKDQWRKTSVYPNKLEKERTAKNYFLSETYDPKYGYTDFTKTLLYQDYLNGFQVSTGYYNYHGDQYYHMKTDHEHDWYIYDEEDSDWHEVFFLDVPEDLTHTSVACDFWYTPDWSSETQMTDFTTTDDYQEYQEELNRAAERSNDSDYDNDYDDDDYDWDDDDSWDSNDSDWDSDW